MADSFVFSTRGLSIGYQGKPLIRDIEVSLQKGQILTLIGPNGAGKSTVLKTITRPLAPVAGKVYIDGKDLQSYAPAELARRMAVVLTERVRPEMMTCYEVAAMGRYPHTGRFGALTKHDHAVVRSALRRVRAEDIADRDFDRVSDGQRQRVLLARALCQEPELLVLDEPTSFLDIRHKLQLLDILRTMAKQRGITAILSLHEIDLAQKISDKILCVKGDHVASFGTPEAVFREENIRALYDIDRGSYDPMFGSIELPRPEGEARTFVICGGGSGIPVFRALQKANTPFVAGILHENDVDHRLARLLAAEVVSERPFEPVSEAALGRALAWMERCGAVINAGPPLGAMNARVGELIERARGRKGYREW